MTGFAKRFRPHPITGDARTATRWAISKGQAQHIQRKLRQAGIATTYLAIRRGFVGTARFKTCQWIAGEPSYTDECKCGQPTKTGTPYCERHYAKAHPKTEE